MEQSSAARRMTESKHTPSCENQLCIETPVGLRKLTDDIMDKDFSRFRDERECEKVNSISQGLKEEIQEIKKQNDILKATCQDYKNSLRSLQVKVQDGIVDRAGSGLGDNKLNELQNEWKQEQEEEKVKFSEFVKRQIQENKVSVIEVIKEKEDLVSDAVDKKKNFVVFGVKEKKNPNKFTRECEERELAKTVIK
ncbi:hypothetical protein E2C01_073422 [Portunus trituberculatus]|uniref:Uncharacterized protein n=1 Tax=Portunus trituberculatus TaxID=210409 RepID=A0A5B7I9P7_PORTR|nr:hypothetical protein [Portunus trituberculatus]